MEQAGNERQEIHRAQICLNNDPFNWWDITFTVLIRDEKPVDVKVTEIKKSA